MALLFSAEVLWLSIILADRWLRVRFSVS